MLENCSEFTIKTANMINAFLDTLEQPICLVAHNGKRFDYPILRKHFRSLVLNEFRVIKRASFKSLLFVHSQNVSMVDVFCVDSVNIFREINDRTANNPIEFCVPCSSTDALADADFSAIDDLFSNLENHQQELNESTPTNRTISSSFDVARSRRGSSSKFKRQLFSDTGESSTKKKRVSYKLNDIYSRFFDSEVLASHNAEDDALNLMKCAVAVKEFFFDVAESQAVSIITS